MALTTTLTTKRLVLRRWRPDDAEALFRWASDPEVGQAAGWPPHVTLEDSRRVVDYLVGRRETYAIVLRDEGKDLPVGSISLRIGEDSDLAIGSNQAELKYWIARPLWGRGLMPEAVREIMRHGFEDLSLEAIWAGTPAYNMQAQRVIQKVGLSHQRSIKNRLRKAVGDYVTEDVSWITRDEWKTLLVADPVDDATIEAQLEERAAITQSLPQISFIRSGGQTGADRGALDAAREAGVPICGWCPPGGLAEDMPTPPGLLGRYPELKEGPSEGYIERTAWNVRDSHATLIVAPSGIEPRSGTDATERFADDFGRPCLVVHGVDEMERIRTWLASIGRGLTLNVAGPRESKTPGTYATTKRIVSLLLA